MAPKKQKTIKKGFLSKCLSYLKQKKSMIVALCRKKKTKIYRTVKSTRASFQEKYGVRFGNFFARVQTSVCKASRYSRYWRLKGIQKIKRLGKIVSISMQERCRPFISSKTEPEQCAICYETLYKEDKVQKTCHTVFHDHCLQTAVKSGLRSCPLCRASLPLHIVSQDFRKNLLLHTANCREGTCENVECRNLKQLFGHVKRCHFKRGCMICTKIGIQLSHHHHECVDFNCNVPMCFFPWSNRSF